MPRKQDSATALAADICHRATVYQLGLDAREIGQLVAAPQRRIIPAGPAGRRMLIRMLVQERRRNRRLIELFTAI